MSSVAASQGSYANVQTGEDKKAKMNKIVAGVAIVLLIGVIIYFATKKPAANTDKPAAPAAPVTPVVPAGPNKSSYMNKSYSGMQMGY